MVKTGTTNIKRGMAEMQKGGVIMDVVNAEQAKIAEDAGAVAAMALNVFLLTFVPLVELPVWLIPPL